MRRTAGLAAFVAIPFLDLIPAGRAVAAEDLDDERDSGALNPPRQLGPFDLPPGARVEYDLAYGDAWEQRLDVYHPAAAHNVPVIFMVHGGGWTRGNKRQWRVVKNKVTHWVGRGCIFVSINNRLIPAADPLTQADDVARALAYVQSHLESWGGDPSRVVVMGHSAGAHLVSLLTAAPEISARRGVKPWLATVSLDSAAMDVPQIMRSRHYRLYDVAFRNDPGYWRDASPTQRLSGKPVAPMLVVCSTRRYDSCPQGRAFAAKAEGFGGHVEVLPVDLTHAEVNDFLGAPNSYTEAVGNFLRKAGLP